MYEVEKLEGLLVTEVFSPISDFIFLEIVPFI